MGEKTAGTKLNSSERREILEAALERIDEKYVFPDVAKLIIADILEKATANGYDDFDEAASFAEAVTTDLQTTSDDAHLRLVFDPERIAKMRSRVAGGGIADLAKLHSNGFARVENLKGGIGYVDIRHFFAPAIAGETAVAAMRFVAGSDAVIVDLRHNTGGNPSMVQFVCSYFFSEDRPIHLNTITSRPQQTSTEYWTLPHVPGIRMPEAALYVLTSGHTFSGGEEFAYNMKSLERGTIIGEATAGGANPAGIDILNDAFYVTVPHATPTNPITGGNWEGCGVTPHIETTSELALETAHRTALGGMIEKAPDPISQTKLEWLLEGAMSVYRPMTLPAADLQNHVGSYGDTDVSLDEGGLILRRKFFAFRLVPLSKTRFWLDGPAAGFEARVEFDRDPSGAASGLRSLYPDGREVWRPRVV